MSTETAWTTLAAITMVGAAFWVVTTLAFVALVRSPRGAEPVDLPLSRSRGAEGPTGANVQTGRLDVEGRPEDLSAKLARALGLAGLSGSLTRVLEQTPDRVVFDVLGVPNRMETVARTGSGAGVGKVIRGEVVFRASGSNRTRAEYAIETGAGRGLLLAGSTFLVLGLIALVVGFAVVKTFAVDSTHPAARAQSVQMLQCIHFLWPPWLFALLYRRSQNTLREALTVLLGNLPYL